MMADDKHDPGTQTSPNIFSQPLSIFGIPVDRDTIFANYKGVYKNRVEKRQRKLIVKTTFIKSFLHDNERIRCLTTGYSPISMLEQLLTGIAFLIFKRARFIFTDQRLLHIPTRINGSPAGSISQILYEDCAKIWLKGRQLMVRYKNGTMERFPYIGRREKKKVRTLIEGLPLRPKEAGGLKGRVHLCPGCAAPLKSASPSCPSCQLRYKSPLRARLWSILLPGGGYFYNRYVIPGILVGLVELMAMGFLIHQWRAFVQSAPVDSRLLFAVTAGFVIEKFMMAYHAGVLTSVGMPASKDFDFAMRKA